MTIPHKHSRLPKPLLVFLILQGVISVLLIIAVALLYWPLPAKPTFPHLSIFQRTISDAAVEDSSRIVRNLFALNDANRELKWEEIGGERWLKAVAWMSESSWQDHYAQPESDCDSEAPACDPEAPDCAPVTPDCRYAEAQSPPEHIARVWITLVPQVQKFCQSLRFDDPSFRLKQYLGLDPNRRYDRFMEIWVKPEDVFRPCVDPEPNDNSCELRMDTRSPPRVKNIDNYVAYFQRIAQEVYTPEGAPWTRLGYTYDWGYGERGVGASEYIIVPQARFLIAGSYTTEEYCKAD
ncbi:MAG: hypothetical protein GYB33_11390 [Gammaproteobacteria bacterium]|uniref:hypothetical protein n=1 Tax=Pseudomaricurvus alcaniphilus TaxID=1166482 RepID=UPI001409BF64|nr:hypothetical protein [Pseudomaricurvus alcaniphilus]MBR9910938.1 hypothetical protein [Gammaproteobacteria bacterium]NHN37160.1 hypothetical protein [Pseudomaricurvus alcaniphilus]